MKEVEKKLDEHFLSQGYFRKKCRSCGEKFFTKVLNKETCGSYRCEGYSYLYFNKLSKQYNFLSLTKLSKMLSDAWQSYNFKIAKPIPIIRNVSSNSKVLKNTLFTVAGVQILEDIISERNYYDSNYTKYFVAQPVIRMKYIHDIGKIDGISTSFINVCIEEINPTLESFVDQIDIWLNLLFSLNINLNQIDLKVKKGLSKWGVNQFDGLYVKFNYGGLELGDAGFLSKRNEVSGRKLQLSDIGFGLERIGWAVNQTPSYFDLIGPFLESFCDKHVLIDHIRTLTLILGYNIASSRTLHGYRIKQLIRNLLKTNGLFFNYSHLIPYYYNFWTKFITLPLSPFEIRKRLEEEMNQNINCLLKEKIGLRKKIDLYMSPQEFIENLINGTYGKKIELNSIKEVLNDLL